MIRLTSPTTRLGLLLIAVFALGMFALWIFTTLQSGRTAKDEARLNANQTEAALESGADAVGAVGAQGATEDAIDSIGDDNEQDIRNAEGADAPVGDDLGDAGLRSLCRRAAYSEQPECLPQPAAE